MNNYKDSIKLRTGIKLKIVLLVPQTQLLYYTCTAKATHTKLTQRLKADYYEWSFTNCRQPYCYTSAAWLNYCAYCWEVKEGVVALCWSWNQIDSLLMIHERE